MPHKSKVSGAERILSIEKYLRGETTSNHLAAVHNVACSSVKKWLQKYLSLGPNGLQQTSKNEFYSAELKITAVEVYLAGNGSLMEICKRYSIKSFTQLQNWILKYNGREQFISSGSGGTTIMTKGRATTYDERIEIVKFCIECQFNYAQTAETFRVSYRQVYTWTQKYLKYGVQALQDKRGKRKSVDNMTEVEKLRSQNKLLQADNKRQAIKRQQTCRLRLHQTG